MASRSQTADDIAAAGLEAAKKGAARGIVNSAFNDRNYGVTPVEGNYEWYGSPTGARHAFERQQVAANQEGAFAQRGLGAERTAGDAYLQAMRGQGPSVAGQQYLQALQNAQAQNAMAMGGAHGNGGLALQQRAAAMQGAGGVSNAGFQGALARQQEQELNRRGLAGVGGNLAQQGQLGKLSYTQMGIANEGQRLGANMAYDQQATGNLLTQAGIDAGINEAQKNRQAQSDAAILGGGLQTAGTIAGMAAMFSDKNLKTDIKAAESDVKDALSNLKAYSYKYKSDKIDGPEARLGIMAQDLEKSKLGRNTIVETPIGKGVNVTKGLSLALAAVAHLNKRMSELEK